MSEMDKWKFNFSFWPSVRVIALPWAHLEREPKSRAAGAGPGEAHSRLRAEDTRVCRATVLPAQTHFGTGFTGSQTLEEVTLELSL